MKRNHIAETKNDFFYALVMFAMLVVMVVGIAADYLDGGQQAYFALAVEADELCADDSRQARRIV